MKPLFWLPLLIFAILLPLPLSAAEKEKEPKAEFRHDCPDEKKAAGKLVIHHFAVGQGDSTFIRTPRGLTMLIDAGVPGSGRDEIVPVLKDCYKLSQLDYVVLTHFHADHMGGMAEVFEAFPIKKALYDAGDKYGGTSMDVKTADGKYRKAALATRRRKIPKLGMESIVVPNGESVKFELVAIAGEIKGGKKIDIIDDKGKIKDDNSVSLAFTIRYGRFDYFTGGDLTGGGESTPDIETPLADVIGDMDVIHSNHHGSKTANNEHFLTKLKPEHIVISVGNGGINKKYKLPSAETMEMLQDMSFVKNIWQTAKGEGEAREASLKKVKNEDGDVIVIADQTKYTINGREFQNDGQSGPPR